MEQMLGRILEDFPGNSQKQRHSVTGASLEYFFRNTCFRKALFHEVSFFSWNILKTSWTAIPENKIDRETVLGDW